MNKIITFLILIIVLLIAGIVYLTRSETGLEKKPEEPQGGVVTEEVTQPESTKETISPKIPLEANFSKTGEIVNNEEGLIFLYGEPGNPAATVKLTFTDTSLCDFGEGKKLCDATKLEDGTRVKIDGNKKNGELEVIEIEKQD